jgi:phage-related protein
MAYSIEYFHARVRAEIEAWPVDVLADYARIVELLVEYGSDLGLPHSRVLGQGLFELHPRGRALYGFHVGRRVVEVHAFIKKTQQTPDRELKVERKRIKEILNG